MAKKAMYIMISVPELDGWSKVAWESGKASVRFDEANRITEIRVENPTPQKLRRLPLPRIQASAIAIGVMRGGWIKSPRYRLRRPPGRKLGDAFYANVARAYHDAVTRGTQPRKTIVADTGAADATVAAWIVEARKRGHLPPAKPGKVSA